jgi:hypothetical protein
MIKQAKREIVPEKMKKTLRGESDCFKSLYLLPKGGHQFAATGKHDIILPGLQILHPCPKDIKVS